MKIAKLFLYLVTLSFCIYVSLAVQAATSIEGELGHEFGYHLKNNDTSLNRPFGIFKIQSQPDFLQSDALSTQLSAILRGRNDFKNKEEAGLSEVDLRELAASVSFDHIDFTLGFQQIAWGETFGVHIVDVMNPRDLRDPLNNNIGDIRVSTFAANLQFLMQPFSLQLIGIPIAAKSIYPSHLSTIELIKPERYAFGEDSEMGVRIGWLFDFGLDGRIFYSKHKNRNLAFKPKTIFPALTYQAISENIHSTGMSLSHTLSSVVLRSDLVFHANHPIMHPNTIQLERSNYLQAIFGADRNFESGWTLGFQYHQDRWQKNYLSGVSSQVTKSFIQDKVVADFFAFRGINNTDFWIQPKLTWHISDALSASTKADIIINRYGRYTGFLNLIENDDRILTHVTWRF